MPRAPMHPNPRVHDVLHDLTHQLGAATHEARNRLIEIAQHEGKDVTEQLTALGAVNTTLAGGEVHIEINDPVQAAVNVVRDIARSIFG